MTMTCGLCLSDVKPNSKYLSCLECNTIAHQSCLPNISQPEYDVYRESNTWRCTKCHEIYRNKGDNTPVRSIRLTNANSNKIADLDSNSGKVCFLCNKSFVNSAQRICCTACTKQFHFRCLNVTKNEFNKYANNWTCESCKPTDSEDSNATALRRILDEIKYQRKDFNSLKAELILQRREFEQFMNKYSSLIETNVKKLDVVDRTLSGMKKDISINTNGVSETKQAIKNIERNINRKEQETLSKDVEIVGVPFVPEESLIEIVKHLFKALKLKWDDNCISDCYRINPPQGIVKPGIIVASFTRKLDRMNLLNARKKFKNLNCHDLGINNPSDGKIYVNERLSTHNRRLFARLRERKRENKFKYLWIKEGKLFVRKNDGDKACLVTSFDDSLNTLK